MGSISSKRGSVRQAPPGVYMPFMSVDGDTEAMDETITLAKRFLLFGVGSVLFFAVAVVFSAVGCIPDISD